ncbi:hypothetical protein MCOR33_003780 [Pyricularia grisea]|uniref:Transcription factor BYE1 n=1 Tax=Pyricularia grisea TaxID=148305 RepID=A0ABQ8NQF5_PYRGI|nr:hypothetical protein MCOR33_003780 [Pyricularia grisea]
MSEAEPRRSVRSTKGQHKALDQLDQPPEQPKKRGRKKKEEKQEEPEEIIRCVCGATDQDNADPNEPWIACETCDAWQHNVCMGLSIFEEDLASKYFCEQCRPADHKELLDGIARGEEPWVDRRRVYEEEKAREAEEASKKPKKGKKAKAAAAAAAAAARRASEAPKEPAAKEERAATPASVKGKPSPAPVAVPTPTSAPAPTPAPAPAADAKKEVTSKVAAPAAGNKRKARDPPEDQAPKGSASKIRKISDTQSVPVPAEEPKASAEPAAVKPAAEPSPASVPAPAAVPAPAPPPPPPPSPPRRKVKYDPPADLPAAISDLPPAQQSTAKALRKSISTALSALEKKKIFSPAEGSTVAQVAERLAIQIERAVQDTHANTSKYGGQIKTLAFNLKSNTDLVKGLLESTMSPPILATMTTDQMASKELQRETAEMLKRAEKQSILISDNGPRIKKTHKGDEIVEDEPSSAADDAPNAPIRIRESVSGPAGPLDHDEPPADQPGGDAMEVELPADLDIRRPSQSAREKIKIDTQSSARSPSFDINKVFSQVKSPSQPGRRLSQAVAPAKGSVHDPDVDRMLMGDDVTESDGYSPTEETDPDVVWRGILDMPNVASVPVTSRWAGGGNLLNAYGKPWSQVFPSKLHVHGRLDEETTSAYLCGMRWRAEMDVIVTGVYPARDDRKADFAKIVSYFVQRKRYAAVTNPQPGITATYLIPVLPDQPYPEIMMNLEDNKIPEKRTEPMLLAVFVYQNQAAQLQELHEKQARGAAFQTPQPQGTPTPNPMGSKPRHSSVSVPPWSPSTPQGGFPSTMASPSPGTNGQGRGQFQQQQHPVPAGPAFQHTNQQFSHVPLTPHALAAQKQQQMQQQQAAQQLSAASPAAGNATATNFQAAGPQPPSQAAIARATSILGPELVHSATARMLLCAPSANEMQPKEWEVIKKVYTEHPGTRDDAQLLSTLLHDYNVKEQQHRMAAQQQQARQPLQQQPQQQQQQQQPKPAPAPSRAVQPPQARPAQQNSQQQQRISSQKQQGQSASPTPPTQQTGATATPAAGTQPAPPRPVSQTPVPIPHVPHTPQNKLPGAAAAAATRPAQTPVPVPSSAPVAAQATGAAAPAAPSTAGGAK